jgi:DNA-binding MarR family transcriptional regulator
VLIALYDDDHQTVGGLGDKLFLDSSTLTPLLKRMEAMGYAVVRPTAGGRLKSTLLDLRSRPPNDTN